MSTPLFHPSSSSSTTATTTESRIPLKEYLILNSTSNFGRRPDVHLIAAYRAWEAGQCDVIRVYYGFMDRPVTGDQYRVRICYLGGRMDRVLVVVLGYAVDETKTQQYVIVEEVKTHPIRFATTWMVKKEDFDTNSVIM
jgi:hypothetical protein